MSVIIQPQRAFPIVRQIANHTDNTTYYVQAVVRDADGNTLDTVNLLSQGGQRYQASWQAVADPSGQGRYISIVTSVYTDAGYTTKSENYGDEENTYLVFDRVIPSMRGGGGGVDAFTVRRIIKEELETLPKPEKVEIPEQKEYEMRWDEILLALDVVRQRLEKVQEKEVDLSDVYARIDTIQEMIEDKPVTPATDLTPVLDAISDAKDNTRVEQGEVMNYLEGLEENIRAMIPKEIKDAIGKTQFVSQFNTFAVPQEKEVDQKREKRDLFDISKLAS